MEARAWRAKQVNCLDSTWLCLVCCHVSEFLCVYVYMYMFTCVCIHVRVCACVCVCARARAAFVPMQVLEKPRRNDMRAHQLGRVADAARWRRSVGAACYRQRARFRLGAVLVWCACILEEAQHSRGDRDGHGEGAYEPAGEALDVGGS